MMADKPRRLPRFSLITLIVAVNVAGVLVWANITTRDEQPGSHGFRSAHDHGFRSVHDQGWPFTARRIAVLEKPAGKGLTRILKSAGFSVNRDWLILTHYKYLVLNILIAVFLVAAAGVLTEFLVRRFRKAKRHDG